MGFIKNLVAKAFNITDAKTLLDNFGTYWGLYKQGHTGYVASCINTMGLYFTKAKFRMYDKSSGVNIEVVNHPYLDVLTKPNNFQTGWELKYFMAAYFAVKGNYYLLKLKNRAGQLAQLIMLDPMRMKPISSETEWIAYYEYDLGVEKIRLEREDVIHLRNPSTNSVIEGTPILDSLKEILDIDRTQLAYMKKFYNEGGFAGQMFTTSATMTNQTFKRAKEELQKKFSGSDNAFKVAVFEQGLQPVKGAYSIKDMELTPQRKLTSQEVMTAFRIPQILLGGSSDTYNRATAEAAEYAYSSTFIDPLLTYADEVFTIDLQQTYKKKNLIIKHDSVAPKDVEGMLKYEKDLFGVGGLTINDIRELEDYEPYDYELAKVPIINVGGAVIRLDSGEQLGAQPNNTLSVDSNGKMAFAKMGELRQEQFDRRYEREHKSLSRKLNTYLESKEEFNSFEKDKFLSMLKGEILSLVKQGHKYGSTIVDISVFDPTNKFMVTQLSKMLENIGNKKVKDIKNDLPNFTGFIVTGGLNLGLLYAFKQAGVKKKILLSTGQVKNLDDNFEVGGELMLYPGDPLSSAKNNKITLLAGN